MSEQVLHIEIDVSFADDQIRGHVRDSARAPKSFSGWLGLIGALDEMLDPPHQAPIAEAVETREDSAAGTGRSVYHGQKTSPPRAGAPERSE